jgi:hypothetical protein
LSGEGERGKTKLERRATKKDGQKNKMTWNETKEKRRKSRIKEGKEPWPGKEDTAPCSPTPERVVERKKPVALATQGVTIKHSSPFFTPLFHKDLRVSKDGGKQKREMDYEPVTDLARFLGKSTS